MTREITVYTYEISCIFCGQKTGTLSLKQNLSDFDQKKFGIEDARCTECEKKHGKYVP